MSPVEVSLIAVIAGNCVIASNDGNASILGDRPLGGRYFRVITGFLLGREFASSRCLLVAVIASNSAIAGNDGNAVVGPKAASQLGPAVLMA